MDVKVLDKWAELLLDMGKRNNLVNFKNTKMGTAEIVAPDFSVLFGYAEHGATLEVYDPHLEEDDNIDLEVDEAVENDIEGSEGDNHEVKYTKEQYCDLYERKLKKHQVLVFNSSGKPIQALKNISKKGRTAIEETGVNILYIAFGFINWTEADNSQYVMKAPILLAPVTIEVGSALDPIKIKIVDDEIIVNPTFSYKLQSEFGINLPNFTDEISIDDYFDSIEAMVAKLKWSISKECKIGVFSFQKINMYQDIKENAESIAKSGNVRALAGETKTDVSGEGTSSSSSKATKIVELHNVVDADSSQSEAIEMAKSGKSFVLQGPPGTGKSQTITNIIAEFLADGKSVLFVSEKLAALSVVYDKLKKAGLEEFCLELHSHKANKKQVIEELCHTIKAQKSALSDRAQREVQIKQDAQRKLDQYAVELHKVRPVINKTLYKLYEEISACRKAPDIEFVIPSIESKGEEYIDKASVAFDRYVEYISSIGYDYHNNVWYGFDVPDMSYQISMQLKNDLRVVVDLCSELNAISNMINTQYRLSSDSLYTCEVYFKLFALLSKSDFVTTDLLKQEYVESIYNSVLKMKSLVDVIFSTKTHLDNIYDADIYKMDGSVLHKKLTRQFSGFFSRIFSSEYRRIVAELRLCNKDGKKPKYNVAVEHLSTLMAYQQAVSDFDAIAKDVAQLFGDKYKGINTDFTKLLHELKILVEIEQSGIKYTGIAALPNEEFASSHVDFASIADHFDKAFAKGSDAEARLCKQFSLDFEFKKHPLHLLENKCVSCIEEIDQVDNWLEFVKLLKTIESFEAKGYLDHLIQQLVPVELISLAFRKSFYSQWADYIIRHAPILTEMSRIPHDEIVKLFKAKDELNFGINKAKIRAIVSAHRPDLDMIAQGSAVSILLREGEKKRKQKSVRQLLDDIGDLVLAIKPCFLMSPLSVSTFLSSDMKFDVIVFDEASQIFPQDAIGAIYRGKQLIVVGDSKQMPPSNFFNSSVVDVEDDSEDESITDFESILDLCSTSFPQRRLKWHYRSRFEELISFSNKNFYDNDLITFPSAKSDAKGVGVDYYYVDGIFDRQSKTNRAEAERIVDLIFENIENYPERSLGVVAFSVAQQTLIEKLLAKRRQSDASKEEFFSLDRPEPFFVKNLETVQGDERDTIIFSIAYAKDSQGRLLLNFGPINRAGGERRLNVAVTRAKYNVQLVTSMHYTDIDLSRTQSVGARLLREYLDYAENGVIALERSMSVSAFDQYDSEFELEVCEFLRSHGYEVDTQVGCSSFKIDLALKRPDSSDYLLAIECDGAAYHSSKTARDRDRLRQTILENMGWKFYRIWSTDWFRNNKVEKERLLKAVKDAVENAPIQKSKPTTDDDSFEEQANVKRFEFPQYKTVDVKSIQGKCNYRVIKIVKTILETEAPVSEEWMMKRLVHLYDREKVTSVVVNQFEEDMRPCSSYGIVRKKGFMFLKDKEIPMLRVPGQNDTPRDIKYISDEELAQGLSALLKQNVSAEKMGLFRLLTQQLGFSRMGDAILSKLESALSLMKKEIEVDGDMISLK